MDSSNPPALPAELVLAGPAEVEGFVKRSARWGWIFFGLLAVVAVVVAVVAAPGEPGALGVAAFVMFVTLLITLYSRAKLNKAWKGTVVRKEVREVRVDRKDDQIRRTETRFLIHARTEIGRTLEIRVSPEAFNRYFAEGDAVVKIRGLALPLKIVGDGSVYGCGHCGAVVARASVGLKDGALAICPHCKCPIPDPSRF